VRSTPCSISDDCIDLLVGRRICKGSNRAENISVPDRRSDEFPSKFYSFAQG
jgi:hypothetical protein